MLGDDDHPPEVEEREEEAEDARHREAVEPIDVEDEVEQGEEFGEIESNKAVSDLKSPMTGSVLEVNEELIDFSGDEHPVNIDPYNTGWLIKVQVSELSELDNLMDEEGYKAYLG